MNPGLQGWFEVKCSFDVTTELDTKMLLMLLKSYHHSYYYLQRYCHENAAESTCIYSVFSTHFM